MAGLERGQVPLERALSKLGLASRTVAHRWIEEGKVRVDGRVVRDPGAGVVPERIRVEIEGQSAGPAAPRTIALHKPRGLVTTREDEQGRPTVYSALGDVGAHLVPVGRLDQATTGLLLLTNDTRLAAWLTEPDNAVPRTYVVTVRGEVSDATAEVLRRGVEEGGQTLAARALTVRKRSKRETHLVVELVEGKNREIRRMFKAQGHEVTKLKRVAYGPIALGELAPGKWRDVSLDELRAAFPGAPLRGEET